jgi:tripartite-type tricarboxylate transporter receptor subunit TctC
LVLLESKKFMRTLLTLLCAASLSISAFAQSYPTKTIKLVIPFPAGGATDIIGRTLAQKLSERLGQSVVVENKPGAGGSIGADFAAKSAADGYTLLLATSSTHSIGPILNKNIAYNPEKDFAPISYVASAASVLIVSPSIPVKNVAELIALAKTKPLTFGSSGNGTVVHLQSEYFAHLAGISLTHIPYKGTALAIPDLASGQVTMMFDSIPSAAPHIKGGRVKALAVTSSKTSGLLPDVPTIDASGLKGYEADTYFGLFAPAGTPAEILARIHKEVAALVTTPEIKERFAAQGVEPVGSDGAALTDTLRKETQKWARVIEQAKVKLD